MTTATLRVQSDTTTLLRALSKTFTRSSAVLGELLQNARRARATRVTISVSEAEITVEDDGIGFADFSVLLSVARSGWEEAVQLADAPYGIGFTSCLFCCEEVQITPKGQTVRGHTDNLIAGRPAAIAAIADADVTQIRLAGHRLGTVEKVLRELTRLAAGFPLPIMVNGEALLTKLVAVSPRDGNQSVATWSRTSLQHHR